MLCVDISGSQTRHAGSHGGPNLIQAESQLDQASIVPVVLEFLKELQLALCPSEKTQWA